MGCGDMRNLVGKGHEGWFEQGMHFADQVDCWR